MKTLYLDCGMGAAGDMLTAALLELVPDPEKFVERLNRLGLPGVHFAVEQVRKCGVLGTQVRVTVDGEEEGDSDHDHHCHHHHTGLFEIQTLAESLPVSRQVRDNLLAVYAHIAEAESRVHGVPVTEIHFHEVGALDAVADITAVCLLMEAIGPERVIVSPIRVGSGQVHCAHGLLPVPAPATAVLLQGAPIYGGQIAGELCTPTGAALLRQFATEFGDLPMMTTQSVGYGMGKKDFPAANCVRALLGESEEQAETLCELRCNVDDMTAEAVGFAMEQLHSAGALEVYTVPVGMKKSRPGTLLCVLCGKSESRHLAGELLRHTTTLGVRESTAHRYTLKRSVSTVETPLGAVRRKRAWGFGVTREKYEYEDLARLAREHHLSLAEVLEQLPE